MNIERNAQILLTGAVSANRKFTLKLKLEIEMGRGKGGKSRTQRKHFQHNRENVWKQPRPESSSITNNLFDIQNPDFDHYYKEQNIVSLEEWDSFMQVLRTPLPAAFRINSRFYFLQFRSCIYQLVHFNNSLFFFLV